MSGMTDNNEFDSIADGMRNDVSEIREMLINNHVLTAEIRRLREENERLQELRLHRMEIESGKVNFGISGEAGRAFAAILLKFFEDNGGKNFFSFDVEKDEMNLNVTIQNLNGELSVTDKLNQLQAENTKLKKELKGIGAEQYYTLQAENRELRKENRQQTEVLKSIRNIGTKGTQIVSGVVFRSEEAHLADKILHKYGLEGDEC